MPRRARYPVYVTRLLAPWASCPQILEFHGETALEAFCAVFLALDPPPARLRASDEELSTQLNNLKGVFLRRLPETGLSILGAISLGFPGGQGPALVSTSLHVLPAFSVKRWDWLAPWMSDGTETAYRLVLRAVTLLQVSVRPLRSRSDSDSANDRAAS